ncbi:hypothetical protein [Iodobacter sp.]|uniref:hypothetical protein n=1 Tax=Iodobacter sp. TaxID=1915058 RepID=UPI0025F73312|nr:hypothetical protein [Iodobacter sp.]
MKNKFYVGQAVEIQDASDNYGSIGTIERITQVSATVSIQGDEYVEMIIVSPSDLMAV